MSANKATSFRVCYRLWTVLSMLAFLHRGEAVNPGPTESHGVDRQWSIGTFNPSGLGGKQETINSFLGDCDLWAISETHLSSQSMHSFRQGRKWSCSDFTFCVGGCPVSLRPHSDKVGSWSGVAMLSKHPTRQVPVRWQPLLLKPPVFSLLPLCVLISGSPEVSSMGNLQESNTQMHSKTLTC